MFSSNTFYSHETFVDDLAFGISVCPAYLNGKDDVFPLGVLYSFLLVYCVSFWLGSSSSSSFVIWQYVQGNKYAISFKSQSEWNGRKYFLQQMSTISKPKRCLFGQGFVRSWNVPVVSFIHNRFDLPLHVHIWTYKVYLSIDAMLILVKR